jgi:uncharacterized iron-regulated membrane protein
MAMSRAWRPRLFNPSLTEPAEPTSAVSSVISAIPAAQQWLSWERLLLDLHSGRIAGRFGVLLVALVGILLICITRSGLAMWWLHRRRRRSVGKREDKHEDKPDQTA